MNCSKEEDSNVEITTTDIMNNINHYFENNNSLKNNISYWTIDENKKCGYCRYD